LSLSANHAPSLSAPSSETLDSLGVQAGTKKFWEGIRTSSAESHRSQWYGPLSTFYFIGRMSAYLGTVLEQPQADHDIQPNSASRTFTSPTSNTRTSGNSEESVLSTDLSTAGNYLTGTQEDYFLGLFWESYHCTIQILDETEFREHYRSLWQTSSSSRKSSALVDIILAVCMQYGLAFLPRENAGTETKADVDSNDASIAGRWYYRRSQMLLVSELERPAVMTLQCHIFTVVYLCNASFQNMAHSALALAVRTAHMLGLHLEPPEYMPRAQKELRKRLWWTLYSIESKTCMKLGRPWCASISQVTCELPADDRELALLSGSKFASYGENMTWLTYSLLNTKLVLAARAVYVAFSGKCADILAANDEKSLYNDSQSLKVCAEFLTSQMDTLQHWLHNVPDAMKTKRKNAGEPLSTDQSALDVEPFAPLWLQRQRLLLELLYHNLSMNLYRPFICFPSATTADAGTSSSMSLLSLAVSSPPYCSPITEGHATSCVSHAIAITQIIHQILTSTNILSGLHEVFQWQWNATLSIIGFILAYPVAPSTSLARNAIKSAVTVFETFGNHFAVAASAANVTRSLVTKADFLIDHFRAGSATLATPLSDGLGLLPAYRGLVNQNAVDQVFPPLDNAPSEMFQIADATDLAFSVDSVYGFEPLYAGAGNLASSWAFTQN
jgi:hypothetical protein